MAKNNEKIWRVLRVILLVGGIVVAIAGAYGALNHQVEDNTKTVNRHEIKLEQHDRYIIEMRTDIKYIRAAIERMEKVK